MLKDFPTDHITSYFVWDLSFLQSKSFSEHKRKTTGQRKASRPQFARGLTVVCFLCWTSPKYFALNGQVFTDLRGKKWKAVMSCGCKSFIDWWRVDWRPHMQWMMGSGSSFALRLHKSENIFTSASPFPGSQSLLKTEDWSRLVSEPGFQLWKTLPDLFLGREDRTCRLLVLHSDYSLCCVPFCWWDAQSTQKVRFLWYRSASGKKVPFDSLNTSFFSFFACWNFLSKHTRSFCLTMFKSKLISSLSTSCNLLEKIFMHLDGNFQDWDNGSSVRRS